MFSYKWKCISRSHFFINQVSFSSTCVMHRAVFEKIARPLGYRIWKTARPWGTEYSEPRASWERSFTIFAVLPGFRIFCSPWSSGFFKNRSTMGNRIFCSPWSSDFFKNRSWFNDRVENHLKTRKQIEFAIMWAKTTLELSAIWKFESFTVLCTDNG